MPTMARATMLRVTMNVMFSADALMFYHPFECGLLLQRYTWRILPATGQEMPFGQAGGRPLRQRQPSTLLDSLFNFFQKPRNDHKRRKITRVPYPLRFLQRVGPSSSVVLPSLLPRLFSSLISSACPSGSILLLVRKTTNGSPRCHVNNLQFPISGPPALFQSSRNSSTGRLNMKSVKPPGSTEVRGGLFKSAC